MPLPSSTPPITTITSSNSQPTNVAATGQQPPEEWPWIAVNVPLFDSSNKQFEEMYYFRWYSLRKAHRQTADHGYLITEWLHRARPSQHYGALPDAAPFHLGEARWLRDPQIAADYARFWVSPVPIRASTASPWPTACAT